MLDRVLLYLYSLCMSTCIRYEDLMRDIYMCMVHSLRFGLNFAWSNRIHH